MAGPERLRMGAVFSGDLQHLEKKEEGTAILKGGDVQRKLGLPVKAVILLLSQVNMRDCRE